MPPTPVLDPVIVTPEAGDQPLPSFFSTVTVNVCALPTWFVADVPIEIRASTQVFTLEIESAPYPLVATPIETPPTVTVPDAFTSSVPGVFVLATVGHGHRRSVVVEPQVPPVMPPTPVLDPVIVTPEAGDQ